MSSHRTCLPINVRPALFTVSALLLTLACGDEPSSPSPAGTMGSPSAAPAAATLALRQVSAGALHTCGVTTDNRAFCWGDNTGGALGVDGIATSVDPVEVSGGLRFLDVRAGTSFSCGIATDNRAWCWGSNFRGQLGDGTGVSSKVPVLVAGGRRFRELRAGGNHACAVAMNDVAWCWGENTSGEVGDGTTTKRNSPVRVAGGLHFKQVRAGSSHSCGLTTDNRTVCWGGNLAGQLGDGTQVQRLTPGAVAGRLVFTNVSVGGGTSCGVTAANVAYCWGDNQVGQVGDGTTNRRRLRPMNVAGGLAFRGLAPGGDHTCGVTTNNDTYCWGRTQFGAVGDGSPVGGSLIRRSPVPIATDETIGSLSSGASHSCGLAAGGAPWCWGWNVSGQLGDGTTASRSIPAPVGESGGNPDPTVPTTAAVTLGTSFFTSDRNGTTDPAVDTVAVGGTVTWTWSTGPAVPHSVQSIGTPNFPSSPITGGFGLTHVVTFSAPGVYRYNCARHPGNMFGHVVVR